MNTVNGMAKFNPTVGYEIQTSSRIEPAEIALGLGERPRRGKGGGRGD